MKYLYCVILLLDTSSTLHFSRTENESPALICDESNYVLMI